MRFKASVSFFLEQDYKQLRSSKTPTNNTTFASATTTSIPCTPPSPPPLHNPTKIRPILLLYIL